ncbi:MAG TPA: YggT family protein [Pyrinomonadaceae bacterium]|nr:YggT family protein [Chloracidobacterium sp.]MBP9934294.1 YggT family protein [Pyrinomonadaceae bacterium]MBK7801509.1 YggT family protein [Chloracidobacterium sp.]MBK9436827.1 YggT family protein [Chloracidobacterium sp.]MBK9766477.1 YggT family protein [Chloracidobacterium sp.]
MNLFLSTQVYPIVRIVVWSLFGIYLGILLLRLVFNYADPNPFGKIGRFGFKVRRATEKWVYPMARFLAMYRIDTRLAPLLSIFIGLIFTYFAMQIIGNTFYVIDGLTAGVANGNPKVFIGFVLYGLLSILVLFIFIRFISSWFVFNSKTFFGFVKRVTDPIMIPVQRLIPPIGMFDISAMIVLLVIGFLQSIVLRVFVAN